MNIIDVTVTVWAAMSLQASGELEVNIRQIKNSFDAVFEQN